MKLRNSAVARFVLVLAVVLTALGVVSAAQTSTARATHHRHHRVFGSHGVLSVAASYLGLTNRQLLSELKSGKTLAQIANATPGKSATGLVDAIVANAKTKLDKFVSAGRITQAQEDAFLAKYRSAVMAFVNRVPGAGHCMGKMLFVDEFGVAASYLGLTKQQLVDQLRAGKTLATIANATPGKSATGLVGAMVAAEKTKLDAIVAKGKLTQAQEAAILAKLRDRFTALVNGQHWGHWHH